MKVAVSIPDPIFEAADQLAKERNIPRSQIFAEALTKAQFDAINHEAW